MLLVQEVFVCFVLGIDAFKILSLSVQQAVDKELFGGLLHVVGFLLLLDLLKGFLLAHEGVPHDLSDFSVVIFLI